VIVNTAFPCLGPLEAGLDLFGDACALEPRRYAVLDLLRSAPSIAAFVIVVTLERYDC
jgi:hypothetical protein